jgi:hypothetical protein
MGWMRSVGGRLALVGVAALIAGGCVPLNFVPGPGGTGGGSCLSGTWNLDSEQIIGNLPTSIPGLTITTSGPGVTLNFTGSGWTLHAEQTLKASFTSKFGNASGTLHVVGDASGTYTSTGSTITFTLASLSGSADYSFTVFGFTATGSLSLPSSGVQKLYGLTGTANDTCSSTGLSLQFPSFNMHAKH